MVILNIGARILP